MNERDWMAVLGWKDRLLIQMRRLIEFLWSCRPHRFPYFLEPSKLYRSTLFPLQFVPFTPNTLSLPIPSVLGVSWRMVFVLSLETSLCTNNSNQHQTSLHCHHTHAYNAGVGLRFEWARYAPPLNVNAFGCGVFEWYSAMRLTMCKCVPAMVSDFTSDTVA